MPDHLISSSEDDLHRLEITRAGDTLLVHSNNREMYGKWGTFGFSPIMAKQLIEGLQAVLDGAERAVTPTTLRMEQEKAARREARKQEPAQTLAAYDDLFGDAS